MALDPSIKEMVDNIYPKCTADSVDREELSDLMLAAMASQWKLVNPIGRYLLDKIMDDADNGLNKFALIGLETLELLIDASGVHCDFYHEYNSLLSNLIGASNKGLRESAALKISKRPCRTIPKRYHSPIRVSRSPTLATIKEHNEDCTGKPKY